MKRFVCQTRKNVRLKETVNYVEEVATKKVAKDTIIDHTGQELGSEEREIVHFTKEKRSKQIDQIIVAATHGEAKHQFKKFHGVKPDHCKGTRKRLPLGYRVKEVA